MLASSQWKNRLTWYAWTGMILGLGMGKHSVDSGQFGASHLTQRLQYPLPRPILSQAQKGCLPRLASSFPCLRTLIAWGHFSHYRQPGDTGLEGNRPWQQAGTTLSAATHHLVFCTPCSPCPPCTPCIDPHTSAAELVDAVQFEGPALPLAATTISFNEKLGKDGLADWDEVRSHRDLVLHLATVAAMEDAIANGFIAVAHQLQGAARWVVFLDGSHLALGNEGPLASWAFVVLVRIRSNFQLLGVRSGIVCLDPASPVYMGSIKTTNNTDTSLSSHGTVETGRLTLHG